MKADCGGAAATLGAFEAALEIGVGEEKALHLILCLAENAIGPVSARERTHSAERERDRAHFQAHSPHSPLITSLLSHKHTPPTIPFHSHTFHHSIPFTHTFHHSIHSH